MGHRGDGITQGNVFGSGAVLIGRGKLVATGTVSDGDPIGPPAPGSQETDKWLALADRDRDTAEALEMWADPARDWHKLYGVFEIIEKSDADIRGNAWASDNELSRFTQTAQTERHTRFSTEPPKKPMTLVEAERFVEHILLEWVRSRA